MISGTTILDSGFLSSIRVIRSFKSSAISGLGGWGGGDTSWVGHRKLRDRTTEDSEGFRRWWTDRLYSLVWKLQGLALDLTVQTHDPLIHERALWRGQGVWWSVAATCILLRDHGRETKSSGPNREGAGTNCPSPHPPIREVTGMSSWSPALTNCTTGLLCC